MKGSSYTHERADFDRFLAEMGLTRAQMMEQLYRDEIHEEMPDDFAVGISRIHGVGVFYTNTNASRFTPPLSPGAYIAAATKNGEFNGIGRYTNHSMSPNCGVRRANTGDIYFVALKEIWPGTEITVNYREVRNILMNNSNLEGAAVTGGSRSLI